MEQDSSVPAADQRVAKRWLRWIPIGAIVVFAIVAIAVFADEAKPHSASSASSGTDTTFMDPVNLSIHVHFDQQAKLRQEFGNIAPTVTGVNCVPTGLWHEFECTVRAVDDAIDGSQLDPAVVKVGVSDDGTSYAYRPSS